MESANNLVDLIQFLFIDVAKILILSIIYIIGTLLKQTFRVSIKKKNLC